MPEELSNFEEIARRDPELVRKLAKAAIVLQSDRAGLGALGVHPTVGLDSHHQIALHGIPDDVHKLITEHLAEGIIFDRAVAWLKGFLVGVSI